MDAGLEGHIRKHRERKSTEEDRIMKSALRSWIAKGMAVGMAVLLGVSGAVGTAQGGTDVGNGMPVGIARGQTARLTVLYPPEPTSPCPVTLQFFDSLGSLLAESRVTVNPGHLMFLDLNGDEVLRDQGETRLQMYGMVSIDQADLMTCSGLVAVLELFDNATFKTMVILVPAIHPPDPMFPPTPILPPKPVPPGRR
jgi:hypothetical protein